MIQYPLVSVIMPLYNKRQYVLRSIQSIEEQTYPNWELIIVDDGSTDGSSELVPRRNDRIKLFRQENRGPAAARNKAVQSASGDFLAFIDADDCYYPFKLEKEIDLLWKEHRADWMMSAYDYKLNGVTSRHYMKDINNAEIDERTIIFDDALNQLTVAGWPSDGLFIKRSLFELVGGFNEEMRYGEITEFILRCAVMEPRVLICHEPLYLHIDVPESTAKVSCHRNKFPRLMGQSLFRLVRKHPRYADFLMESSRAHMISYGATLIWGGRRKEARRFLLEEFPFSRDARWLKLLIGSWMPLWFLNHYLHAGSKQSSG